MTLETITKNKFHYICWLLFICYEITAAGFSSGYFGNIISYIIHYGINISLFYLHALIVLPYITKQQSRSIVFTPILVICEVLLFLVAAVILDTAHSYLPKPFGISTPNLSIQYFSGGIWRAIYFLSFSTGYFFLKRYLKEEKRSNLLVKQNLELRLHQNQAQLEMEAAKNAYLHAQINPHFLFNTLNFIFSQVHRHDEKTAKAVMLLANIMRYAIDTEHSSGLVPLAMEIEQAKNLITLYQLRQRDHANISIEYPEGVLEFRFLPLILLTLLENIIKHGDLSEEEHPARLDLSLDGDTLVLTTSNLINSESRDRGYHIGLENIRQRLKFTYGEKAVISTTQTPQNHFIVKITVEP